MQKIKKVQTDKKWVIRESRENFKSDKLRSEIVTILSSRGIKSEDEALEFLYPEYEKLASPFDLKDMEKAVDIVLIALKNNKKITIYGDYDVDGITATALLYSFFKSLNADVNYYIPSRHTEGYGLNVEAVRQLVEAGTELLITVDCGSGSIDEIKVAKAAGLEVVVTDHHSLKTNNDGHEIVEIGADAFINPRRADSKLQMELAGVGVAFYLVRAVFEKLEGAIRPGQEKWFMDLVALGTICDVVPLLADNRILVTFGLKVLAVTKRTGLRALAEVANFDIKDISPYHVGFLLGPRLNASGRLETANLSLELLIEEDFLVAKEKAKILDQINKDRQELTEKILNEAREAIGALPKEQKIYLLANEKWPAGVVGIVASRLVDEFGKPVLVMEDKGTELKGSARSISSFNIIEALTSCGDLLGHYGGHKFAAGFTLDKSKFLILNQKLIEITDSQIREEDLTQEIVIDKELDIPAIDFDLYNQLKLLEPFGQNNKKPIFILKNVIIADFRLVGNPAVHLKLTIKDGDSIISGMIFNYGEEFDYQVGDKIDIVITIEENIWRDQKKLEFRALDLTLSK